MGAIWGVEGCTRSRAGRGTQGRVLGSRSQVPAHLPLLSGSGRALSPASTSKQHSPAPHPPTGAPLTGSLVFDEEQLQPLLAGVLVYIELHLDPGGRTGSGPARRGRCPEPGSGQRVVPEPHTWRSQTPGARLSCSLPIQGASVCRTGSGWPSARSPSSAQHGSYGEEDRALQAVSQPGVSRAMWRGPPAVHSRLHPAVGGGSTVPAAVKGGACCDI